MDSRVVEAWLARLHELGVEPPSSRRILLVDDERDNLDVLAALLDDEYDVHRANSGREALALVERVGGIAVVVADQRMPGMTGVELLGELSRRTPETVRLILTAFSDHPALLAAINEGHVHRFLVKPWSPEEMRTAVADAAWVHRGRATLARLLGMEARRKRELAEAVERLSQSEQQLVAAERLSTLGRFTAGITHDVRNNLTVMMSLLELVQQTPPEIGVLRTAQNAFGTLDALLRLVNDINAFARGQLDVARRGPVELTPFVDRVLGLFRSEPAGRARLVKVNRQAAAASVWYLDEESVRLALLALLRSASELSPRHMPIELVLREVPGEGGAPPQGCIETRHRSGTLPEAAADAADGTPVPAPKPSLTLLGREMGRAVARAHGGRLDTNHTRSLQTIVELWLGPVLEDPDA